MVGLRELWIMTLAAYHHSQAFFVPMAVRSARRSGGDQGLGGVGARWAHGRWVVAPGQHALRSWCPGAMVVGYGAGEGVGARRGAASGIGGKGRARGGALSMGYLEEVPDELAENLLQFEEAGTGKTIECYAERFAVIDGRRYLAAFPKDLAVAIAFEEDGEVAPVPLADPLMDRVFPLAEACIKDLGPELELLRTPSSLTVQGLSDAEPWTTDDGEILEAFGDIDDEDEDEDEDADGEDSTDGEDPESSMDVPMEEDGDEGDVGEDKDKEDEDGDEEVGDVEDLEEVELLGEFALEGEEFLLVRFVEPFLLLAKESDDGRYMLLESEEDEEVTPLVEELMSAEG